MIDFLLRTNRFNLSEVKEHFINPCCFGEDFAAWMRGQLASRGIEATEPDQEDWGWYLDAKAGGQSYMVGFGGNSDEDPADPNMGEWRVLVKKDRSISDKLFGRKKLEADDPLVGAVRDILVAEGWEVQQE